MKSHARTHIPALLFAATNAALLGAPHFANAATANITNSVDTLIESAPFSGATRITAEGVNSGANSTFWDYGVLDFSTVGVLPQQSQATSLNSITLNLVDKAESFAIAGTVDVYATDYTGSLTNSTNANDPNRGLANNTGTTLSNGSIFYQANGSNQPQGIGTALNNLYLVGTINYTKTNGQVYSTTIDLSNSTLSSFIVNQMNTGGIIRFAVADSVTTMAADVEGSAGTSSLAPPSHSHNFNSITIPPTNTLFSIAPGSNPNNANLGVTITGSGKAIAVSIPRILNTASLSQNITVTNTGTQSGNYTLINSVGTTTLANGVSTSGTLPVTAGGVSNITAGFNASTIMPGSTQPVTSGGSGPVSSTVTIRNQSNATDSDATVTLTAQKVVATRLVDNTGANGTPIQFGKILSGAVSTAQSVTFDTENTGAFDFSNQSLTKIEMLGNTTLANATLGSALTGTNDKVSVAAGTDKIFDSGSDTTSRNVTFTAGTVGGLYQTNAFFDGFGSINMLNLDTAIGSANTTARVYVEADVYQAASVSSASSGNVVTLTNAKHTANVASTALGDIGARSAAFVTSVALTNAQTGWTVDPGLNTSTSIADGQTVNAAAFDTTGKLNGTYTGKLAVGMQNDQSIFGAAPNDLGTSNISLTATVTTNSGSGTANILAGGSLAGYSIHRGSGKDSTVSFLAGTSTSGGNLSVTWADGVNTTISDKATVGNTASSLYVLQMSYDGSALTNGSFSPTLTSNIGSHFIGAVNGDGAVTPVELNGRLRRQPRPRPLRHRHHQPRRLGRRQLRR